MPGTWFPDTMPDILASILNIVRSKIFTAKSGWTVMRLISVREDVLSIWGRARFEQVEILSEVDTWAKQRLNMKEERK